jgi:hypothetical protein
MSFKRYITESQRRSEFAVTGDIFTAVVNEELAVEMPVMYHNHELVILEADQFALDVMEHCGCQYIDDEDSLNENPLAGLAALGSEALAATRLKKIYDIVAAKFGKAQADDVIDKLKKDGAKTPKKSGKGDLATGAGAGAVAGSAASSSAGSSGPGPSAEVGDFVASIDSLMASKGFNEDHIDWDKAKKDADDRNIFAKPGPISGYNSKVMGPITKGLTSLATSIGKAVHPNDKTVDKDLAKQQGKFLDKLEKQINNEATPASQQAAMDAAFKDLDQKIASGSGNYNNITKDKQGNITGIDRMTTLGNFNDPKVQSTMSDLEADMANFKAKQNAIAAKRIGEAEYQGREVKLGKPMSGDVKKYKVYVRDPKTGNVKKVNFGDPNMQIRRDNPEARKNFRARHNCADKKDRTKAGYWSCRMWSKKPVSKILKGK